MWTRYFLEIGLKPLKKLLKWPTKEQGGGNQAREQGEPQRPSPQLLQIPRQRPRGGEAGKLTRAPRSLTGPGWQKRNPGCSREEGPGQRPQAFHWVCPRRKGPKSEFSLQKAWAIFKELSPTQDPYDIKRSHTLLNNPWVHVKITMEIRKYTNEKVIKLRRTKTYEMHSEHA